VRYAFTTFSCPDLSLQEALDLAKQTGYAAIEPRLASRQAHGVEIDTTLEERASIRARIEASGIEVCCLGTSARFADPALAEAGVADAHGAIDLAADIGTPFIRVFGGFLPEGVERADARERIVSSLRSLAEHAADRGVVVCMETHDDWTDPGEVVAIMRGVDQPAVGLVWDVMHPVRSSRATIDDTWQALRQWIHHVHMHDGSADPDRRAFLPIGTGDFDHRQMLALLHEGGYDGIISGEWIADWMSDWNPPASYLADELATMEAYERELEPGARV
jgi:sugar phosphate isomerase/epimerase